MSTSRSPAERATGRSSSGPATSWTTSLPVTTASILVIAHSANRWALQHLLEGAPLEELVDALFDWQPGWVYVVNASSSSSDIA